MALELHHSSGTILSPNLYDPRWIKFRIIATICMALIILWSMSFYFIPLPPQKNKYCDPGSCLKFWFIYLTCVTAEIHLAYLILQTFITIKRADYYNANIFNNVSIDHNQESIAKNEWELTIYPRVSLIVYYLYVVGFSLSVTVTLVYWTSVFEGFTNANQGASEIHLHGINTIIFTMEYFGNNIIINFQDKKVLCHALGVVCVFDFGYTLFTIVYWQAGGKTEYNEDYIYPVIDFETDFASAFIYSLATALLHILVQLLVIWLKYKYIRPYCLKKYVSGKLAINNNASVL